MRIYLSLILSVTLFLSCQSSEEPFHSEVFEVITAGIGMDCNLVLIDIKEEDLERMQTLTGSSWDRYHAYNLDKTKFGEGVQKLRVRVRNTLDSELVFCTFLGPTYPSVTVVSVERIE